MEPSALHEAVKDMAERAVAQVVHQPCKAAMKGNLSYDTAAYRNIDSR